MVFLKALQLYTHKLVCDNMTFLIGQKITCIDISNFNPQYAEKLPILGHTYTVRNLAFNRTCLQLREIVNSTELYAEGPMECSFKATRFAAKGKHG